MVDAGHLICWNCNQRSPPGECIHCNVQLSDPEEAFGEKKPEPPRYILEIRRQGNENIQIEVEEIQEIVSNHFKIKKLIFSSNPQFLVEHPGDDNLPQQFDKLIEETNELVDGLKPKIQPQKDGSGLVINYLYIEPPGPTEYRSVYALAIISLISVFLAGVFNYTQLRAALGNTDLPGFAIFGVYVNAPALLESLMFTLTLVVILVIKDYKQLKSMIQPIKKQVIPFYIPAPPIFELGTLGSVYKQDYIPKTRSNMFGSTYFGPIIAWCVSGLLVIFSLPLSKFNPAAAELYSSHSIIANGQVEPFIFTVFAFLSNAVGLTDLNMNQSLTQNYVFHPITIGAMAGFYIVTFSLLPAVHFNGGFIVRSILGSKVHSIMSYLTIIAIAFLPGAWPLAILLFFINELLKTPEILNLDSPKPAYATPLLVLYFIIVFVSFPIPTSIVDGLLNLI